MKNFKLRAYEIEHSGDVDHACAALRRAGACNVQALGSIDYEEESILLSFDAPDKATAINIREAAIGDGLCC